MEKNKGLEDLIREVNSLNLKLFINQNDKWYLIKDYINLVAMISKDFNTIVLVDSSYQKKLNNLLNKYSKKI